MCTPQIAMHRIILAFVGSFMYLIIHSKMFIIYDVFKVILSADDTAGHKTGKTPALIEIIMGK